MVDALEVWKDFDVAMVGALAALAGLVIVSASVNIADIVTDASLVSRLAAAIATLVLGLVVSAIGLTPVLSLTTFGVLVLVATAAASPFQVIAAGRILRNRRATNQMPAVKAGVGFLPLLAYLAGGIVIVTGGSAGLSLVALGSMLSIISGLTVSWVVLVEILR